ncbi:response regulator [Paenibacillus sp. HWE-109]|uniref:response regulator transcription factor n=1 Tax=Paenibacillus sp. HWE-109 TaxID=1306526 RepID=UPI001EDFA83F|nr:response regulator [Paenibacillus sp. HWE-109]UKS28784.1 response regulator [Paenibacillus sp. HWE-109]
MKWKSILIVEDEQFTRDMLREIIDWESAGLRLAGEAGNGLEALAFIREHKPDIVICDIIMPLMDGVELLQKVREEQIDSKFIMLSCANDFDYARQALEYGASNYILKLSLSAEKLQETLKKVRRELDLHASRRTHLEIDSYYSMMWDRVWGRSGADAEEPAVPLEGDSSRRLAVAVCADAIANSRRMETMVTSEEPHILRDAIVHVFNKMGVASVFYWLPAECDLRPSQEEAGFLLSPVVAPKDLLPAWRGALMEFDQVWYGKQVANRISSLQRLRKNAEFHGWEYERKLIWSFENFKRDDCAGILRQLWSELSAYLVPMYQIKEACIAWDQMFRRIAQVPSGGQEAIVQAATANELLWTMIGRVNGYLDARLSSQSGEISSHPQITQVLAYIRQNFEKDITVKMLAKIVVLDDTYLSNLFKKETGVNLISFIHQYRIERSLALLRETTVSIEEIARQVGFMDINYFVRIFKRYKGIAPGHYRKTHHGNM